MIVVEDILKSISSNDIDECFNGLSKLSAKEDPRGPRVSYIFKDFRPRFMNLPLDLVPKELGDEYLVEYFNLVREFINENKETFEECKLWPKVKEISLQVYTEIRKHRVGPEDMW